VYASGRLELEVDELLEVGGHELVDHEDDEGDGDGHEREGHGGEADAVAAFEGVGEPVDYHADEEDDEDGGVGGEDFRDLRQVPWRSYLPDHLCGGLPRHLVCLGWVEVGAGAEEEPREGDVDERLRYGPSAFEPWQLPGSAGSVVDASDDAAGGYYAHPYGTHACHGPSAPHGCGSEAEGYEERYEASGVDADGCPPSPNEDADAVEAAPYHEVPACAVPQAAEEHGVHAVDVAGYALAPLGVEGGVDDAGGGDDQDDDCDPYGAGEYRADDGYGDDDGVGAEGGCAVAAHRDVEVVLQPLGERDVPPLPEAAAVRGLVGGVEVCREAEAHEEGHAYGDVGVAGEIGIDLQGVDEQG